jgi:hypothetical protein
MMAVQRYALEHEATWNAFVAGAKNATFLFRRDYMGYHSDRFSDHSLMLWRDDEPAAVLPANLTSDGMLVSHGGLTYGGLLVPRMATLVDVLESFYFALRHLHEQGVAKVLYKMLPAFYCRLPAGEAEYALFLLGARLCRRDSALVVRCAERLPPRKGRKSEISKARRFDIRVGQDAEFRPFWEQVLVPRLAGRFGVKPVHSLEEITLLAGRFPDNIKQFSAWCGEEIVAGVTIYETEVVAHAQYIAVSEHGQQMGALDHLIGWLLDERYKAKQCFDFGTCNEAEGRALNHGLLDWKEAFGGRCYCHDFYEIDSVSFAALESVLRPRL